MTSLPLDKDRFLIADSIGSRREQEDAAICKIDTETGTALLVVCDGVGGSRDGGTASRLVIEFAEKFWREHGKVLPHPEQDLARFCREAHEGVLEASERGKTSARTTLVALYLNGQRAWWVHSGDSRLYHFRAGKLRARTRDHSVVEVLVEQGEVAENEMGSHPDQGRLLQSIGGSDYKEPTQASDSVTPDDAFLLCTDGFWERTPETEMAGLLYAPLSGAKERLAEAVQRAAERNGSKGDNLTVAVMLPARLARPSNRRSYLAILLVLLATELIAMSYYFIGAWLHGH
jgi:serine/threonine protein phosphatase PrpC